MPRPPRLKSELDATSPINPPTPAEPTAASSEPRPAPQTSTTRIDSPTPKSSALVGKRKTTTNKGRVGPYLTERQADRLRACYVRGWLQDHQGTFSDMLEQFLLEGAQKIEREKNAGQPWPAITAGAIKSLSQMNIEAGRRTDDE
jgi:hypothetical protein